MISSANKKKKINKTEARAQRTDGDEGALAYSPYSEALRVRGVYVGSCGNFSRTPRSASAKHFSRGTLENVAMNKSSVGNNTRYEVTRFETTPKSV